MRVIEMLQQKRMENGWNVADVAEMIDVRVSEVEEVEGGRLDSWMFPLYTEALKLSDAEIAQIEAVDAIAAYKVRAKMLPHAPSPEVIRAMVDKGTILYDGTAFKPWERVVFASTLVYIQRVARNFKEAHGIAENAESQLTPEDTGFNGHIELLFQRAGVHMDEQNDRAALALLERAETMALATLTYDPDEYADPVDKENILAWANETGRQLAKIYASLVIVVGSMEDAELTAKYIEKNAQFLATTDTFKYKSWYLAMNDYARAALESQTEDYASAASAYMKARESFANAGQHIVAARMLNNAGIELMWADKIDEAEEALLKARAEKVEHGEDETHLLSTDSIIAEIHRRQGREKEALTLAQHVYDHASTNGTTALYAARTIANIEGGEWWDIAEGISRVLEDTPKNRRHIARTKKERSAYEARHAKK